MCESSIFSVFQEMYIRGTQVNYYFVCKTKLWLFSHNITMEQESDIVKLGKLLHKEAFRSESKDIHIGSIAIDIVRRRDYIEIREIKRSKKFEDAHKFQTLYYLYYLKKLGINAKAVLSFPKLREKMEIELDEKGEKLIEKVLDDITKIVVGDMPKPEYQKSCKSCAYFEFCFS